MSKKGAPAYTPWTTAEEAVLRQLYPSGAVTACMKALPNRTEHAIRTRVGWLGLKLTLAAKHEIVSAAHCNRHPPSKARERRLARTALLPIDEVLHAWTRRRTGGAA